MIWQKLSLAVFVLVAVQGVTAPAFAQVAIGETPDNREIGQGPNGHLFRGWEGERRRLQERGVAFDFQYISDTLANLKSERKERLTNWNRVRGTMDINLGLLAGWNGVFFHVTAVWQGGGNMGTYLGLLTLPAKASANTFRLDSWWLEKRMRNQRIVARIGQFAGQGFHGEQLYATSFIMIDQALWRLDPQGGKGLDGTLAYDWSPADVNRRNRLLTAGLRFNEPPWPFHNTVSLGYVRWTLSSNFAASGVQWRAEQGLEFNTLLHVLPMMFLQPVIQYYANVGGGTQRAVILGFRVKVEL
jgi:carbohydrate-selective porin OprB